MSIGDKFAKGFTEGMEEGSDVALLLIVVVFTMTPIAIVFGYALLVAAAH
jgi:hypothetical protein